MTPRVTRRSVGAISVAALFAACGGDAGRAGSTATATTGAAAPVVRASGGGYRFVHRPIVVGRGDRDRALSYEVFFRLNRSLPRRGRHYRAAALLGDGPLAYAADPSVLPFGRRKRACYSSTAYYEALSKQRLRVGELVRFRLMIYPSRRPLELRVPIIAPLPKILDKYGLERIEAPYAKALGCGGRGISAVVHRTSVTRGGGRRAH